MTKRVLVLVEGQTEERFIKDVLSPIYLQKDTYVTPTILVTKKVKDGPNFKGGVTSFNNFANDLKKLLPDGNALITTLIDYYGLPSDFPGMDSRPMLGSARVRAQHVEAAVRRHFGDPPNFFPFFALHEFEAWLFADHCTLPETMGTPEKEGMMAQVRADFPNPEDINERPELAPSKRVLAMFPGYRKVLHGPTVIERIGLPRIRANCVHFAAWLDSLDAFAAN